VIENYLNFLWNYYFYLILYSYQLYPIQWWTQQFLRIFAWAKVGFISLCVRLFGNYPIHYFIISLSKSKCDKKLSKLIMKLLLLLNFVFISLCPIQWWTQQFLRIFTIVKVGFISLCVRLFGNYPIHYFIISLSKSKCDKKLSKLIMKLLLLSNFVFISLCPIQWWTQQFLRIFAWAKVGFIKQL